MSARELFILGSLGAVAVLGFAISGSAGAREESKTTKSERGGLLTQTDRYPFEAFFYPTGVRVVPSSRSGTPVETANLSGMASFHHLNSPNLWFSRSLGLVAGSGGTPGSLDLAVGLANAPATDARLMDEVSGLPDAAESTATLTVPREFVTAVAQVLPVPPQGGAPAVPRYTYGPGYYGYGYYESTRPGMSPPRTVGSPAYGVPRRSYASGESVGGRHRDWTAGRDNPIAKPWLRPMD